MRHGFAFLLRGLMFLLIALGNARGDAAPSLAATSAPSGFVIQFKIVDAATQKPMPDVTLKYHGLNGHQQIEGRQSTDARGIGAIHVPSREMGWFSVAVHVPTYVPVRADWPASGVAAGPKPHQLPEQYTLQLERGTPIGGRVIDDIGQPIKGATVSILIHKKFPQPNEHVDADYRPAKSDKDGRWTYPTAPARFDHASVGAYELSHVVNAFYEMVDFPPGKVKDQTATITIPRGVPVKGVVLDQNGKPIKGARIGVGKDRVASNATPEIKTDDQGRFQFGAEPAAQVIVTARANGHAPDQQQFTMGDGPRELTFKLGPPHALRGRVVDVQGKPITGASIYMDTWRGTRTLNTSFETDSQGKFEWTDAPSDPVLCDIVAPGYADDRGQALQASDKPVTITLRSPTIVIGTVVDADTGKSIPSFRMVPGIQFNGGNSIYWQRDGQQVCAGRDGQFRFELGFPYPGHALRIEADGYAPADSRIFKDDEGKVELAFKLHRAAPMQGIVRGKDGRLMSGVNVILVTPSQAAQVQNGKMEDYVRRNFQTAKTDIAGKFSFPPQSDDFLLLALSDAGYAQVSKEQFSVSPQLTLQAWGRIEGTVKIGSRPAVGALMVGWRAGPSYDPKKPNVMQEERVTVDANGHFVMDRVPAGKLGVGRALKLSAMTTAFTHSVNVDVKSGQSETVTIGGTGRPVVGRIDVPPEIKSVPGFIFGDASLFTNDKTAQPDLPDELLGMTVAQRQVWLEHWKKTEAGKKYLAAVDAAEKNRESFPVKIEPDGSFRIEDIPAGDYLLRVSANLPPPVNQCGTGTPIGSVSEDVKLPPMPGGRSDDPLVLPTITMKALPHVNVGDVAPDFSVKSLDGKTITLSEYRGKVVLLDFWATWCGPCVAETPNLKAAYDAFGASPKFAMISLSLDEREHAPKIFAEKRGIKWMQGFVGDRDNAPAARDYGVCGIPSIWLIGPDGRIVAKDLRGKSIKPAVEKALSNMK